MLKTAKSNLMIAVRAAACSLRDDRFRKFLEKAPKRLLSAFDHPSARDRFLSGESPLPPSLWDIKAGARGQMTLRGVDCLELAERYGTPLYVVDAERLRKNFEEFRDGFSTRYPKVEVAYSYKTNPLPGVLAALDAFGADAEVVSGFELWLALELGVSPGRIVYNGPGKTAEDLELAVSRNVKLLNIDGPHEIDAIEELAGRHGRRQNVGVRVVTSVGWQGKFGFPIETGAAFEAYRRLKGLKNVSPAGMHVHIGAGEGVGGPRDYARAAREMCRLARLLREKLDIAIRYLDLGGGYSTVRTVRAYDSLDAKLLGARLPVQEAAIKSCNRPEDYAVAVTDVLKKYFPCASPASLPTLILEPGTAVTCSAMFAMVKVLDIKPSRNGIRDVIVDGGRSFAGPTGWECHELLHASRLAAPGEEYFRIFGPTCTPYDVLFQVKRLPSLKRGDVLAIMDAGAYFVPMQTNFSFPRAAAVMVEEGNHRLIRKREEYGDIIRKDILAGRVSAPCGSGR
jgi:diaminopimelate decarboxylase